MPSYEWTKDVSTHCSLHPGFLALAHLALSVKVPVRLRQQFGDVGTFRLKRVPEVVRGHDIAFASLQRLVQTEQADNICCVTVEVLSSRGGVDSDLVDLGRVVSQVLEGEESQPLRKCETNAMDTLTCPRR
jgi:hypothetical protein